MTPAARAGSVLTPAFFERPTLAVASDLLGKALVRRAAGAERAFLINDVEAYDGPEDRACHASRGRTPRTDVMFGPAGAWYVYFVYGMHWMLNVVTGPEGYPAAVLIRGVAGHAGPGRLTKALAIGKALNGKVAEERSGLWIEDRGIAIPDRKVARTPRIGVEYADEWAKKPWRFLIA